MILFVSHLLGIPLLRNPSVWQFAHPSEERNETIFKRPHVDLCTMYLLYNLYNRHFFVSLASWQSFSRTTMKKTCLCKSHSHDLGRQMLAERVAVFCRCPLCFDPNCRLRKVNTMNLKHPAQTAMFLLESKPVGLVPLWLCMWKEKWLDKE